MPQSLRSQPGTKKPGSFLSGAWLFLSKPFWGRRMHRPCSNLSSWDSSWIFLLEPYKGVGCHQEKNPQRFAPPQKVKTWAPGVFGSEPPQKEIDKKKATEQKRPPKEGKPFLQTNRGPQILVVSTYQGSILGKNRHGHGQKQNRTPSEHPNPNTKMGSKMGGEFTYPRMGSQNGVDNHSHIGAQNKKKYGCIPVFG